MGAGVVQYHSRCASVGQHDSEDEISCEGKPCEIRQEEVSCAFNDGGERVVRTEGDQDECTQRGEGDRIRMISEEDERPDEGGGKSERVVGNEDAKAAGSSCSTARKDRFAGGSR